MVVPEDIRRRDYFHGLISVENVNNFLHHEREASFLIRENLNQDLIISFKDFKQNIRHVHVPTNKSHSILKQNPQLLSIQQTLDHILQKKSSELSYPVTRSNANPQDNSINQDGFICSFCESMHETKRKLFKHFDVAHKLFECARCSQIYFPSENTRHKNRCVPVGTPVLQCPHQLTQNQQCPFTTTSNKLMRQHEAVHAKNIFSCVLCRKGFADETKFNAHNQKYHGRHYRISCDHCDKTFSSKLARTNHMRNQHIIIDGTVFFKCTLCSFHCQASYEMQVHMAHHRRKFIGPFQCEKCQKMFKTHDNLKKHQKKKVCDNEEVIDEECIDEILSTVAISTSKVSKVLNPIIKKNGPKSAPRNLKRKISVKMNSFNYEIEAEILDDDQDLFTRSVFSYPKDPIAMTNKLLVGRGVVEPRLSVGFDVGWWNPEQMNPDVSI